MTKNYSIFSNQIDLMKHCVGFENGRVRGTKHRQYEAYRNYFTTSGDDAQWDDLVSQGLAIKNDFPRGCGENPKIYVVSIEGLELLSGITGVTITEKD